MPSSPPSPPPRPVGSIAVVTPCFNAAGLLEETIESVIGQRAVREGRVKVDYWVIDGGSTDGSVGLLERYAERGVLRFVSERDAGMYDALVKGFERVHGDVCCYLNAGDLYHPTAFDVVKEVMESHDVSWITGFQVVHNDCAQVVRMRQPPRFVRGFIRRGLYGRLLPHIQQESTFWRRELLDLVDFATLRSFRYAGDFFLWHSFAAAHDLVPVGAHLGGFRLHPGQLSSNAGAYLGELERICGHRITILDRIAAMLDRGAAKLPVEPVLVPMGYYKVIRWGGFDTRWGPARR